MGAVAFRLALLSMACVLLPGCGDTGPTIYHVKGVVRYQGTPLPLGTVFFVPDEGPAATAAIGADGTYAIECLAGKHKVGVIAMPAIVGGRPDLTKEGGMDYTGVVMPKSLIPETYNSPETSGIVVEVHSIEENAIDLELK